MSQTIYRSWRLRRSRLEHPPATLDPGVCRQALTVLDHLLATHRQSEEANCRTRFPAIELEQRKPLPAARWHTRLFTWRSNWESQARDRAEPLLQDIAEVNPQDSLRQNAQLAALAARHPETDLFNADLGALCAGGLRKLADAAGSVLFEEIHPLRAPGTFARLIGSYISGMASLLCRNDRRNAAEYIVDGLHEHQHEARPPEAQSAAPAPGCDRLYVDRRTILIHDYARRESSRSAKLKPGDASAMVRAARRFIRRRAESKRSEAPRQAGEGGWIAPYARRIFGEEGEALSAFEGSAHERMLPGEDITKAFYLNMLCLARAMRIVAGHAAGGWLSEAVDSSDERLFDEAAGLLSDPAAREWSLRRFRMDLASGDAALRFTAAEMIARLGTLDDIGLLLDLTLLAPPGPGALRERRQMLRAARRLAGLVEPMVCRLPA